MDDCANSPTSGQARGVQDSGNRPYEYTEGLEVLLEARRYNAFLCNLVRNAAPAGLHHVVDFGAGIGTFSGVLKDRTKRLTCIEIDPEHRMRLTALGYEVASLETLAPSSVDYIYTLNVLEHIEDDVGILRSLYRLLKPGGRLLVYTPAFEGLWSSMDDLVGHVRRYRRSTLSSAAEAAGFRVTTARYCDSAGAAATLGFKVVGRRDGKVGGGTIRAFDRLAFPVGRLVDRCGMQWLAGKNVYVLAERPR